LQALVKGGLPVERKRVVVAGSGPLLLAVAEYLRKRGAAVAVIAEQAPWRNIARFVLRLRVSKLLEAIALRAGLGAVRYLTSAWPVAAEGRDCVEAVVFRHGDAEWRERCDYLACGFGLVPNAELAALLGCEIRDGAVAVNEWQETSVPRVYAAGETMGVGGLDLALASGEIAGCAAAGRPDRARTRFVARARALRFRLRLDRAFALRDELRALAKPDTIVCRCEDVPLGRIREQHSWRSAKLQTRCGMGPCQGRVCGPAVEFLLGAKVGSVRPPLQPARLEHLAE
jgi:NADPH-dependent 2,4-dienoyl-CoA reductase/sulfur reductase-like enzyme